MYTFPLLTNCVNAIFFYYSLWRKKHVFLRKYWNSSEILRWWLDQIQANWRKSVDLRFYFVFNQMINIWRSLTLSHRNWSNLLFDNENFEGWYRWNLARSHGNYGSVKNQTKLLANFVIANYRNRIILSIYFILSISVKENLLFIRWVKCSTFTHIQSNQNSLIKKNRHNLTLEWRLSIFFSGDWTGPANARVYRSDASQPVVISLEKMILMRNQNPV